MKSGQGKLKKDQDIDIAGVLVTINEKLDSLMLLKETVRNIDDEMQMLSNKYDQIPVKINDPDRAIMDLTERVERMEKADVEKQAIQLKTEVNELQWRSRQANPDINGVAQNDDQNLLMHVNNLARTLNVPELTDVDVAALHRLAAKHGKIPGIFVVRES